MISFVQEAKQAIDLMGRWETIDVTDALELLSPVFGSEEVSISISLFLWSFHHADASYLRHNVNATLKVALS